MEQEIGLDLNVDLFACLVRQGLWKGRLPDHSLNSDDWGRLVRAASRLPRDQYARDTYRYRSLNQYHLRVVEDGLALLSDAGVISPYLQTASYNPEFGGLPRRYERNPVLRPTNAALGEILRAIVPALWMVARCQDFTINVHQIRYLALPNSDARNSPPGYHKDGERFISVHLLARRDIDGGANCVADNSGSTIGRFELSQAGDCFLIDDEKVWHSVETMTVGPRAIWGARDILLIDYIPLIRPL